MTNNEEEAEVLYKKFIEFCEKNDVIPQQIILKHFNERNIETFFDTFRMYK